MTQSQLLYLKLIRNHSVNHSKVSVNPILKRICSKILKATNLGMIQMLQVRFRFLSFFKHPLALKKRWMCNQRFHVSQYITEVFLTYSTSVSVNTVLVFYHVCVSNKWSTQHCIEFHIVVTGVFRNNLEWFLGILPRKMSLLIRETVFHILEVLDKSQLLTGVSEALTYCHSIVIIVHGQ